MAKKRKKQRKLPKMKAKTSQLVRVDDVLKLAEQQLDSGQSGLSMQTAERALKLARIQEERDAASKILAQAYLEQAQAAQSPQEQSYYLERARQYGADKTRVQFSRALGLWRSHNLSAALADFEQVAQAAVKPGVEPLPNLTFLHALACLAAGHPWTDEGLAPAEANTLGLVQALLDTKSRKKLQPFLDQALVGDPHIWHTMVALREDAGAVDLDALAAQIENTQGHRLLVGILHYLHGVAAMQQDKPGVAKTAWLNARDAGWDSPSATKNLDSLLRTELIDLANQGQWQEIIAHAQSYSAEKDAIWSEIVGTAYFHRGSEAAQAGNWQLAAKQWRQGNEIWGSRYLAQNLALAEEAVGDWLAAAEAWREMVRRRPRKKDHADYLSDDQVAAIWEHIADCYLHAEFFDEEAIPCFQNAIKYRPDDTRLRLRLVDAYLDEERIDAAENELNRILDLDQNNIEALTRLGSLYAGRWERNAIPIWKRVLAVDPSHVDAKTALAEEYLEQARQMLYFSSPKQAVAILKNALTDLPGNPQLMLQLGMVYRMIGKKKEARQTLLEVYHSAPQDVFVAGGAMHELLHLDGGDKIVETLLPEIRQIPRLLPDFWVAQADQIFTCRLAEKWALSFYDEAIALAEQPAIDDTKAGILIDIYEAVSRKKQETLVAHYRKRIQTEAPESGALEYIDAYDLNFKKRDPKGARRMLNRAKQKARKSGDDGVRNRAETVENLLANPFSADLGFPGGLGEMARILERILEDDGELPDFF